MSAISELRDEDPSTRRSSIGDELDPEKGKDLSLEAFLEHADRHDMDIAKELNDDAYEGHIRVRDGDTYIVVSKRKKNPKKEGDGIVEIKLGSDEISENELEAVKQREIDKLVSREEKVSKAAEMFMGNPVDDIADGDYSNIVEEFERIGGSIRQIAENYYDQDDPADISYVLLPFSYFFELKPYQEVEDDFHYTLDGEVPLGDSYGDQKKLKRNKFWLKKYLNEVVDRSIEEYSEDATTETLDYLGELRLETLE